MCAWVSLLAMTEVVLGNRETGTTYENGRCTVSTNSIEPSGDGDTRACIALAPNRFGLVPAADGEASWLTAVFQYDPSSASMMAVAASSAASTGWNGDNFEQMSIWFKALMADSFA